MSQPRILVVDDDIALCGLLREVLEFEGILVDEAHHVVEAERILLDHTPDAVVLDIGLPGIDGIFYTTRLRENPATSRLPIVAISGSEANAASAIAAGATAFVRKPFDPLELLTLLERAIGVTPLTHAFGEDESSAELRRLVDIGRRRHELEGDAYRETLTTIASSLELRGVDSSAHTSRVTAYAMRLAVEVAPSLTDDPGLEWGFMFHDIGNTRRVDRQAPPPAPASLGRCGRPHSQGGRRPVRSGRRRRARGLRARPDRDPTPLRRERRGAASRDHGSPRRSRRGVIRTRLPFGGGTQIVAGGLCHRRCALRGLRGGAGEATPPRIQDRPCRGRQPAVPG